MPCAAGRHQPSRGQTGACLPCPVGFRAPVAGLAQCITCGAGTYSNTTGAAECQPCPINTFNIGDSAGGSTFCSPCADSEYTRSVGAKSCSVCATTEYPARDVSTAVVTCTACDAFAVCDGRSIQPLDGTFYARDPETGVALLAECLPGQCRTDEAGETVCAGANRAPAAENPLCAECSSSAKFAHWRGECVECSETRWDLVFASLALGCAYVAVIHPLAQNTTTGGLKIALFFTQTVLLLLRSASGSSVLFSLLNADVFSFLGSSGCVLRLTGPAPMYTGYVSAAAVLCLAWPLHALVAWAAVPALRARWPDAFAEHSLSASIRTLIQLSLSLVNLVVVTSVEVLDLQHTRIPGATCRVRAHPHVHCDAGSGYGAHAAAAWCVLFAYICAVAAMVWRATASGKDHPFWGVVTDAFRRDAAVSRWWQAVLVLRRVAVVVSFTLLRASTHNTQLALTNIVSLAFFAVHVATLPFSESLDNAAESASLTALIGVALLLQADATDDDAGALDGGRATDAAAWVALLAGVALFVYVAARQFGCGRCKGREEKCDDPAGSSTVQLADRA